MKQVVALLLCLLLMVTVTSAEDDYWYDEDYYEDEYETEFVMIEREVLEYFVEEIIGRAEMTMEYLAEGKHDRNEAIYHLDEVLTIASLLQMDYLE